MSLLRGYAETLSATFMLDETPVDAGTVAVSVTDQSGTVVSAGAATAAATGVYTYALPAQMALGPLVVTWTGTLLSQTTHEEVIGSPLFNLPDLRAADKAFADTAKFPTAALRSARDTVADEFARICGRSFVPKGAAYTTFLDNTGWVLLPDSDVTKLVSVTIDGTAQDLTTLFLEGLGKITGFPDALKTGFYQLWDGTFGMAVTPGKTIVTYEYGFTSVPDDLYRAAVQRARFILASFASGIPDRATSFVAVEGGSFTLATPGSGVWQTGIPDVDAVLARYNVAPRGVVAV